MASERRWVTGVYASGMLEYASDLQNQLVCALSRIKPGKGYKTEEACLLKTAATLLVRTGLPIEIVKIGILDVEYLFNWRFQHHSVLHKMELCNLSCGFDCDAFLKRAQGILRRIFDLDREANLVDTITDYVNLLAMTVPQLLNAIGIYAKHISTLRQPNRTGLLTINLQNGVSQLSSYEGLKPSSWINLLPEWIKSIKHFYWYRPRLDNRHTSHLCDMSKEWPEYFGHRGQTLPMMGGTVQDWNLQRDQISMIHSGFFGVGDWMYDQTEHNVPECLLTKPAAYKALWFWKSGVMVRNLSNKYRSQIDTCLTPSKKSDFRDSFSCNKVLWEVIVDFHGQDYDAVKILVGVPTEARHVFDTYHGFTNRYTHL